MIRIHAIRTGSVRIRPSQLERRPGGVVRVLLDRDWAPWLPIYAWAIEHPEGVIVVDTGETARATNAGYYPRWHPYYRLSMQVDVQQDHELGPQLASLGITAADVRVVILTHLHTDHTGGLAHLAGVRVLVSRGAHANAVGFTGRLQGYMPQHWPASFAPEFIEWSTARVGPFDQSHPVTPAGDVLIVPTPGHTPGHVSVIVRADGKAYFIAGDASYTDENLLRSMPDGLTPQPRKAIETQRRIVEFATGQPTVYLPTHDAASEDRLRAGTVLATQSA